MTKGAGTMPARRSAALFKNEENKMSLKVFALSLLAAASLAQAQTAGAPTAPAAPAAASAAPAAASAPKAAAPAAAGDSGKVAWYGQKFAGRKTASGERFNPGALTMAHKSLPFATKVKVTNLKNNRSVVVRVNDRGPMTPDRVGDVSQAAARKIGMLRSGVVEARLDVVAEAPARKGKK